MHCLSRLCNNVWHVALTLFQRQTKCQKRKLGRLLILKDGHPDLISRIPLATWPKNFQGQHQIAPIFSAIVFTDYPKWQEDVFYFGLGVTVVGGGTDGSEQLSPSKPKANLYFSALLSHTVLSCSIHNVHPRAFLLLCFCLRVFFHSFLRY